MHYRPRQITSRKVDSVPYGRCSTSCGFVMKHAYCWVTPLLVAVALLIGLRASAQQPWRPGLIYSFSTSSSSSSSFLLQLDFAYTTAGGDSAWAFNRLLRPLDGTALQGTNAFASCRKSCNNLFGARLICQTVTTDFVLESLAKGSCQMALSLRLRPRAAVGST